MTLCALVTQSFLTLCDPMDCSLPGSPVHGILPARILEWAATSFSRVFPTQGANPRLLHWQVDSLPLSHQEALNTPWDKAEQGITLMLGN